MSTVNEKPILSSFISLCYAFPLPANVIPLLTISYIAEFHFSILATKRSLQGVSVELTTECSLEKKFRHTILCQTDHFLLSKSRPQSGLSQAIYYSSCKSRLRIMLLLHCIISLTLHCKISESFFCSIS